MKNMKKMSFLVLLLSVAALTGCGQKTTGKSVTNNYITNPSTSSDSGSGTGSDSIYGCNGVAKSGATSCYYTNIPRLVFSGPGTNGGLYWSSKSTSNGGNLPTYISQNQFRSDAYISFRMKPSYGSANEVTLQGKKCAAPTLTYFTKLKVYLMLRRASDSIGQVKELTANVNSYSNTAIFDVSSLSTTEPYVVEIVGVNSNHRCNVNGGKYGSALAGCPDMYYDIPFITNSTTGLMECVAMNLEMATDSTYNFPN